MIVYTESELKTWFIREIKRYPNSNMEQHLKSIFHLMFSPDSPDNLKNVLEVKYKD